MITGTVIYEDGSQGSFSFKNWESFMAMSWEGTVREIRLFRAIKNLDCEIIKFEKEFNDDYKNGFYFTCKVGFCESLGEQGFTYTFFYDKIPTEDEILKDIRTYIKVQIEELNGKLLSAYEENHLEAFNKLELGK